MKRIISVFLCMMLLSCVFILSAEAKVVYTSGDWVYEMINNNTEFEIDEYIGAEKQVFTVRRHNNINVTAIGDHAFSDNNVIESITINNPISNIKNFSFLNCLALTEVVLNSGVTRIGSGAFSGCTSLKVINLENTQIDIVGYTAFMNCDSLTEVTLPETVVTINEKAFAYCDSLSKITIPESVITIHENAFYNSPNVVIYCYKDSAAHVFAETNSIEYVLLEPVETYILGDADNDGTITVLDATLIQLVLAQKADKLEGFDVRSDVDKDAVVSVMDATLIQQHVADLLDDTYEIGKSFEY